MPTTINASNTTGGAVVTGDGSGILELQSGGVTGITVNGPNVTVAGTLTATGGLSALTSPVSITGNSTAGAEIRLPEDTDNGSNYVAIKAPNALAANVTFTLPTADGTNGQFLQTNGSGALAFATVNTSPTLVREARTSNTQLGTADVGKLIAITSGTFSQTFAAAATLGNGWFVYLQNAGTGQITLDPNGSETIDGLTTYIMYPNELRIVLCNGTSFTTVIVDPFIATFDSTVTFTTPPGYVAFSGYLWGAGGSGGIANGVGGGGGGGACVPFYIQSSSMGSSQTITIGAGGTSRPGSTSNNGIAGGNSSIGSLVTSYGGGGGGSNGLGSGTGGGGGGALSAGDTGSNADNFGGQPNPYVATSQSSYNNSGFGGGSCKFGGFAGRSAYGGGAGGTSTANSGASVYGGGGGAGVDNAGTVYYAGTSVFGGAGGSTTGSTGSVPGGGGAAGYAGTASGAGANGRCIIMGVL